MPHTQPQHRRKPIMVWDSWIVETADIGRLLRYWLDTYARPNVSAKTLDIYEHTIEHHIIPTLGAVATQKLTPGSTASVLC